MFTKDDVIGLRPSPIMLLMNRVREAMLPGVSFVAPQGESSLLWIITFAGGVSD